MPTLARLFSNLFIISAWTTPPLVVHSAANPVVDLGYAKYAGVFNSTTQTTQFLGMRYAAPPTGNLRWRSPQRPETVSGIQLADEEPPTCFFAGQGNAPATPFRNQRRAFFQTEDCLFLNVYSPGDLTDKQKRPVVVWIHGGGYMSGSASGFRGTDIFNGVDLIQESDNGVVAVVIQYRLGVFGFLPGTKVKQNGVLNAGLLDQQFALKWVQQHIEKFGGDPARVTIWGESAGAGSVFQHVIANGGKTNPPLFRGAITSSTFLPSQYRYNDRIPEILYGEVVQQTNCSSEKDTLSCLRSLDAGVLEQANVNIGNSGFFGTFIFVPVVDGDLIQQRPTEALRQRKVNGAGVLAVTNTFEGALFVNPATPSNVDVANYVKQLFPNFGQREIQAAAAQYRDLGDGLFQVIAIMGEAIFICPTYFLLRAFGGRGFKSEFAVPPGGHGNDVIYYFPSQNPAGPPFKNPDFDKAFSESFLNFALALDPNIKTDPTNITPHWSRWLGETEMLFNRTESGQADIRAIKTSSALLQRCDFWESVGALSGQ